MFSIILSACVLAAVTMWVYAARIRRAAVRLDEVARPAANRRLAHRADAAPHDLVPAPDPSGGDFSLGALLLMARLPAQRRIGVLLFRGALHHRGLWGCGETAAARTVRELDGHPHVRLVGRLLLCSREPHPSIAAREGHRRLHRGKNATMKTMLSVRREIGWSIL